MKELRACIAVADRLAESGEAFAIATVVKIGGSTYRRPGARMLVDASGNRWGTLSGGCLEDEVVTRAMASLATGDPELVTFQLGEDDIVLGFGTGCDGSVHVLIQPVAGHGAIGRVDVLRTIGSFLETRKAAVVATVLATSADHSLAVGYHYAADESSLSSEAIPAGPDGLLHQAAVAKLGQDLRSKGGHPASRWESAQLENEDCRIDVLLESLPPPIHVLIFGDGHDAGPLVDGVRSLGWKSTIVGRKPAAALQRAFPQADDHLFLMHAQDATDRLTLDSRTAAVVMTHNYGRDEVILNELLFKSAIPYIGMLGPVDRTNAMLDGAGISEDERSRLYAPIGLDIATETPEEIALSICAEVQAVMHGRAGVHLRDRKGPIHN